MNLKNEGPHPFGENWERSKKNVQIAIEALLEAGYLDRQEVENNRQKTLDAILSGE